MTRFAPRSESAAIVPFAEVAHLFHNFKHTAWRLETRRGYASDRNSTKWQRWQAGYDIAAEPFDDWRTNVAPQVAEGSGSRGSASSTRRPPTGSGSSSPPARPATHQAQRVIGRARASLNVT